MRTTSRTRTRPARTIFPRHADRSSTSPPAGSKHACERPTAELDEAEEKRRAGDLRSCVTRLNRGAAHVVTATDRQSSSVWHNADRDRGNSAIIRISSVGQLMLDIQPCARPRRREASRARGYARCTRSRRSSRAQVESDADAGLQARATSSPRRSARRRRKAKTRSSSGAGECAGRPAEGARSRSSRDVQAAIQRLPARHSERAARVGAAGRSAEDNRRGAPGGDAAHVRFPGQGPRRHRRRPRHGSTSTPRPRSPARALS